MKDNSRTLPVTTDADTKEMELAVQAIRLWGYRPYRPTKYQLKIKSVSYYPEKGTIVVDGKRAEQEKGLDALKALLDAVYKTCAAVSV